MKRLLFLPILLFVFLKANAQSDRWMYLSSDNNDNTLLVDTLKGDIRQLSYFGGHNNIVMIWTKTISGKSDKKESNNDYRITRYAVDTTINQIRTMSVVSYHDNAVAKSESYDNERWRDVIPGSMGEEMIRYCRALHNERLMLELLVDALPYHLKTLLSDKKN